MLLTVFAHILLPFQNFESINATFDYIYMFHMPVFVYISGYFGKSEKAHSLESIIRLIFIYFVFNSVMGFICGFSSLITPLYSYWYLIALIAWRLTAHHLAKFKEINLILLIIALFSGFFPSINNTFAAARIIAFYPFYMLGYKTDSEEADSLINTKYIKRLPKGLLCLAAGAVIAFFAYNFFNYTDDDLMMFGFITPVSVFGRIALFLIAFLAITALRHLTPSKKIPLLAMMGENSLAIFVLHRPFTLIISDFIKTDNVAVIIGISLLATVIICLIFGNKFISNILNRLSADAADIFTHKSTKKFSPAALISIIIACGFILNAVKGVYAGVDFGVSNDKNDAVISENTQTDIIHPIMNSEEEAAFDNSFRLTFAGDLILLEDQVKRARTDNGYDFSPVFEYAESYISSADYAIGVFEGPMAGEEAGYSTSNYDDGKELYLNFPDQFGTAVKNAGFDLVTTANNHLLDKGVEGVKRTLDILDSIGLDHTGSYRSEEEKKNEHIKLIECDGIKMAVLSYTYGTNYYGINSLTSGYLSYVTSVACQTEGELFETLKASVEADFREAKALNPDLIIVLPHLGTQFLNNADAEQTVWFEIFKENGADIILGDHPHAVQPVLIEDYNGKKVFTAYCPGNFANIYRENQGDTSMLIDVFIDRTTKEIIGGGIVPLYTQAPADGNYRALPVYEIMTNEDLRKELSTDDLSRAEDANEIITKVLFGSEVDVTALNERYYFNENGFIRRKSDSLILTDEMMNGELFKALETAESVCFLGDSLTEGTKNGGCPWYEPIEKHLGEKEVFNFSKGGCTISYICDNADKIAAADLYVIAVGTNDVRYRDSETCAMTAEDYANEAARLTELIYAKNTAAKLIFIAPWYSTDGDPYSRLGFNEKTALNDEFSEALEQFCAEKKLGFINPNPYLKDVLTKFPTDRYLLDHIHPNSGEGVVMYSEAVLLSQ